jgi:putative (di)nucleoside polyphosphate hydrolase
MSKASGDYNAATLDELLQDSLVRMVMQADKITEKQLMESISGVLDELGAGSYAKSAESLAGRNESDYCPKVGVVLLNKHNQTFIGLRKNAPHDDLWQLPQGGIRDGEAARDAAFRVLRQQIGTDEADVLAESKNWLFYELPRAITGRVRHKGGRGQRQKWLVMRFKGKDGDIDVDGDASDFCDWKWISISELPKHSVSFKRLVHLSAIEEFLDALGPYE